MKDNEFRTAIVNEILGYFRQAGQTTEQGNVAAVRYLMLIAMEYQRSGALAAMRAMDILNMPPRYKTALMEILEKDCLG